jgi:anti-sigma B factor antagonist
MPEATGSAADEGRALPATDLITTSLAYRDGVAVLSVGGEIDAATAAALDTAIAGVLAQHPSAVVVDLSAVTFLGSAGLRILVATHARLSGSGHFAVVAHGPATSRPIQLTGLDEVLSLYPTLDDALVAMRM